MSDTIVIVYLMMLSSTAPIMHLVPSQKFNPQTYKINLFNMAETFYVLILIYIDIYKCFLQKFAK